MLYLDLLLEKGADKAPKKLYVRDLPCVFAHVRHGSLAGQPQFYSLSIRLLQLFCFVIYVNVIHILKCRHPKRIYMVQ